MEAVARHEKCTKTQMTNCYSFSYCSQQDVVSSTVRALSSYIMEARQCNSIKVIIDHQCLGAAKCQALLKRTWRLLLVLVRNMPPLV